MRRSVDTSVNVQPHTARAVVRHIPKSLIHIVTCFLDVLISGLQPIGGSIQKPSGTGCVGALPRRANNAAARRQQESYMGACRQLVDLGV